MTFQKGHKLATGRPKGSLNKLTKANREFLHSILFDEKQFIKDWMELDLNGRMELRTRLASYILPKAKDDNLFIQVNHIQQIYTNRLDWKLHQMQKKGLTLENSVDY